MSFGGPGSAFSFAAPTRPSRRNGSYSGSVGGGTGGGGGTNSNSTATSPSSAGPTPVDPPANPSHGAWSTAGANSPRQREGSNNSANDSSAAPRSFSSILSPSLAANGVHSNGGDYTNGMGNGTGDFGGKVKPFVYSRDFLLSLYDDEKAKKRPLELAVHEMATRDLSGSDEPVHKPWALQDYREGEKELFATSIHPANARPSRMNRTDSSLSTSQGAGTQGANGTLDLSTLGTLPRDRDRALGSPSIRSPSIPGAEAGLGRERRTRERSTGPGSIGIQGGVLGGIAPVASPITRKKDGEASKEVWQGGRWRRGQAQESEDAGEKRPSAFGSRRFPLADDGKSGERDEDVGVPDSWEETTKDDSTPGGGSAELNGSSLNSSTDSLPAQADLTASVLGSLALGSDPLEDSLLSNKPIVASGTSTPSRIAPPPGLTPVPPPSEVQWQYRDPSGQVQGPFVATVMHDWYRQQFFQSDLRVKRVTDLDFETLADLIRRTGDSEKPFLAPKPSILSTAPGSAFSSAPGTPQLSSAWGVSRAQTPLDQLAGSRFGAAPGGGAGVGGATSSFYEPFGSNAGSPSIQAQILGGGRAAVNTPGGTAVDPWGAPLPTASSPSLQQLFAQQQHQQQMAAQSPLVQQHGIPSSVDVLRQLQQQNYQQQAPSPSFAPQYAGHLPGTDVFGRPSPLPTPSYFDPRQLVHGSPAQPQAPTNWIGQQQQPTQQQAQSQPWSNIGSPVPQTQTQQAVASPIGPPVPASNEFIQTEPKIEVTETIVVESKPEPEVVAVVEEVKISQPEPQVSAPAPSQTSSKKSKKEAKENKAAPPPPVQEPTPSIEEDSTPSSPSIAPSIDSSSTSNNNKTPAVAPWAKDETISPVGTGASPSPSLREIQQAEAREADKRKAAARIQAAQANIQAAQRLAAAEAAIAAEQLPSSANWAAGPAQVPPVKPVASTPVVAAPWTKPATPTAKSSGKTLKEIQEEEEKRKKAQLAAQQQAQGGAASFAGKGYAGTAAKSNTSAPWTTVAVKPAVVHAAATSKPIIPGLPSAGSVVVQPTSRSSVPTSTSSTSKPSAAAPAPVRPAAVSTPSKPSVIRSISVNGASSTPQVYDAENPPPPSAEFVAWIRQALKGLQVPMDEFIQVLLSFPLDASSDVLEIISDSVYANSSTLDGRRFANDYAARRKNDVAVRYPQIFAKGKVVTSSKAPVSMAQALASPAQGKPAEWSVKVSGGKKKGKK
ncbi:GYF domain-containing protein [Sporobolomyces salmoneus]|uniref:GYF domain-containing protein n=1 Tax=Sporobolomyces salmoneus TaxID=183962 RepID=UPI00316F72A1